MTDDAPVVLVTGASSGIGRATALSAARRGDHLVLVARAPAPLEDVAGECRRAGAASVLVLPADVASDPEVARCVERAVAHHDRLDVVVSCAGVVAYGRLEETPAEVFEGVVATNLHGAANLARHVIPVLRDQESGSFVVIGSLLGHVVVPCMGAYSVSKWGLRALARQLALENSDLPGVRVGYLAPGGVDTPIYQRGANYTGTEGRPPFPVVSPGKVARRVLRHAAGAGRRHQVGLSNDVARLLFSLLPGVYDRVVGPTMVVLAQERGRPAMPREGNVRAPGDGLHALTGGWGSGAAALVRNLAALARTAGGKR